MPTQRPCRQQSRARASVWVNNEVFRSRVGFNQPTHEHNGLLSWMNALVPPFSSLSSSVPIMAVDRPMSMEGAPDVLEVAYVVCPAWPDIASLLSSAVRAAFIPDYPGAFLWQARVIVLATEKDALEPQQVAGIERRVISYDWPWIIAMNPFDPIRRVADDYDILFRWYLFEDIPAIAVDKCYVRILVRCCQIDACKSII
jgi:hypothetical protein